MLASDVVLQFGLPEFVPNLIAGAATVVLFLMLVAMAGYAYKSLTGGIEWPEDREEDDALRRGDDDDEWDYY